VTTPDHTEEALGEAHERELRKLWLDKDVFYTVVLAVVLFAALWVGLSSGLDYVHIGRSGCVFVHDGYSQMHLQCGTGLSGP